MAFKNILFPDYINYGSSEGFGTKAFLSSLDSGLVGSTIKSALVRKTFNVESVRSIEEAYTIIKFWRIVRGCTFGFLLLDKMDHTTAVDGISATTNTDVSLGTQAANTRFVQLRKKYIQGSLTFGRNILKPIEGTVSLAVGGTPITSGYSINYTNGIVTFTSFAPTSGDLTWGGQFYTPVRFTLDSSRELIVSLPDVLTGEIPVSMIELLYGTDWSCQFSFGGGKFINQTGDYQITSSDPKVLAFNLNGYYDVLLPTPSGSPGQTIYHLYNWSTVYNVAVKSSLGVPGCVLAPRIDAPGAGGYSGCEVCLSNNGSLGWDILQVQY